MLSIIFIIYVILRKFTIISIRRYFSIRVKYKYLNTYFYRTFKHIKRVFII